MEVTHRAFPVQSISPALLNSTVYLNVKLHLHLIIISLFLHSLKLRSLRVNVGQLLATIMPDLDLQQVNYDIDVVDEILGQVVEQMHEISST